jgi:hypothetical protein
MYRNNESRQNVYQSQPEAGTMIRRVRDENAHKRMKAEAYINKHGGTSVLNKKNS